MASGSATRSRWLTALAILQVLLLTFATSLWWSQRQNTLFHNGAWTLGKGTGKFVFYTFEFLFRPLQRGEVNLAADMGFQEILSAKPEGPGRRLESLACSAGIAPAGYLWVEVGVRGQSRLACRISRRKDYPSGWHRFGDAGDLERFTPLAAAPALSDGARRDRIELLREHGSWTLRVNGRPLGAVPDDLPLDGSFGFRGSGDLGAPVLVGDVEARFSDPGAHRSWSERERFAPRRWAAGTLAASLGFAFAVVLLRLWRRRVVGLLLTPAGRERLARIDDIGTTAILGLLAAGCALRPGATMSIPAAFAAAEIVHLAAFGLGARRGAAPAPVAGLGRAAAAFGTALALLAAAAFARHGDLLGWGRYSTWQRLQNVHPDAFLLRPAATTSSPAYELTAPLRLLPGEPFFVRGGAWRGQVIRVEFVAPRAGTLDLAFQQQAFLTRGDPSGEELPLQRRLLRLSTRGDVASGLASGTHKAAAPFLRINGELLPGAANRLEVRSDERGVAVVLNGKRTRLAAKPLGYGETGLMAWDEPVAVTALRVEATAGQGLRERLLPLAGLLLPLAAVGGLWGLLRLGGAMPLATVAALALGGLAPLGAYLAATLPVERNTLLLLSRERIAWLDLALVAASLSLPALVLFLRQRLRGAVAFFYLACGAVAAALLVFALDQIAATRPELLRRWRPAPDVVVPGELVGKSGDAGPWYAQGRMIGASNHVWRQAFGTRQIAGAKPPGSVRVFLMGGSQAWGSGAADSFSTFDQLLGRRLRARGLPVDVYNAGVNGAGISQVRWTWDGLVAPLAPDVLILDVGLNDSAALAMSPSEAEKQRRRDTLAAEFTALLDRARAGDVDVLLVLEPMCLETTLRPDAATYAGLARIAAERGIPVVAPQEAFARLERDHLLWWDTAHLTPFGQEAMSRLLEGPVAEIVARRSGTHAQGGGGTVTVGR